MVGGASGLGVGEDVGVGVGAGCVGVGVGGTAVGVAEGAALGRERRAGEGVGVRVAARRGVGTTAGAADGAAPTLGAGEASVVGVGAGVFGAGAEGAADGVGVASACPASLRSDNAGGIQSSGTTPMEKRATPAAAPSKRTRISFSITLPRLPISAWRGQAGGSHSAGVAASGASYLNCARCSINGREHARVGAARRAQPRLLILHCLCGNPAPPAPPPATRPY